MGTWAVWGGGAFLVLLVLVLIVARSTRDAANGGTAAYQSVNDGRTADSMSVLALGAADGSMPVDSLVALETTLHTNGFSVSHDAAHTRYTRIMLDSADVLIKSGLTYAARNILGNFGHGLTGRDSARAARLTTRLVSVEAEQAREGNRRQRLAQAEAGEARIALIRGLRQGNCTPPVRAVRNRVRKNPEWSDEMIATTACNRVQIGMTAEQAIAGWGRPRDVNRTSGSFGVHEQWVYGEYGSGYLYFEDGVLTTVQN